MKSVRKPLNGLPESGMKSRNKALQFASGSLTKLLLIW